MDVSAVLCDLDGVVWLAGQAIPGSAEAVARLRASGRRVVFVTNNSAALVGDQEAALAAIGIEAVGDVLTSAGSAASLVRPGERVLVCGGPGVAEAVTAVGAVPVAGDDDAGAVGVDVVVVGLHREFSYARLTIAAAAIRAGARLIGTNDDATYPTPTGPIPGGGSLLAAVSVAGGVTPVVAGKPFPPMAALARRRLQGPGPESLVMIGDRPSTDGRFASAIGCPFALVRTGVTAPGEAVAGPVAIDAPDLAAVVDVIVEGGP